MTCWTDPSRAHRYIRAFLAGIALPTIVVGVVGLIVAIVFDRLDPPLQRTILVPIAANPVIWGLWNVLWVAAGSRRLPLAWHGTGLSLLLVGIGMLAAPALDHIGGNTSPRCGCAASHCYRLPHPVEMGSRVFELPRGGEAVTMGLPC